jgi:hypothetical protein
VAEGAKIIEICQRDIVAAEGEETSETMMGQWGDQLRTNVFGFRLLQTREFERESKEKLKSKNSK